jgi:hypothetical protein
VAHVHWIRRRTDQHAFRHLRQVVVLEDTEQLLFAVNVHGHLGFLDNHSLCLCRAGYRPHVLH